MKKHTIDLFVWFLALGLSSEAQAQLIAIEDSFAVPAAQQLVAETPGVLENDLYNGETAANAGATAVLGYSTGTVAECDVVAPPEH